MTEKKMDELKIRCTKCFNTQTITQDALDYVKNQMRCNTCKYIKYIVINCEEHFECTKILGDESDPNYITTSEWVWMIHPDKFGCIYWKPKYE